MIEKILTRHDTEAFGKKFDSIKWALDTYVKGHDSGKYKFALLFGEENAPEKIEFYSRRDQKTPELVWYGSRAAYTKYNPEELIITINAPIITTKNSGDWKKTIEDEHSTSIEETGEK